MKGLKLAVEKIREAKDIAVVCHINPDGDAIGSLLSLGMGLEKLGKKVYMICADEVPRKYKSLPGASRIRKTHPNNIDLSIAVDCSTSAMLGSAYNSMKKAKIIMEIDHHIAREPFADVSFVDPEAAAVGEQIYLMLKKLKVAISWEIAQNILTSIIVETSSFRLPNARAFTFKVCGELVKTGADFYKLVDMIFWSRSREVTVLSGVCLSRCKFISNGRLVWSEIKKKDFEKVQGKDGDVDPVADEMRAIKNVSIVVLFREKNKQLIRVSLRSKGKIDVSSLAKHYGGGGHHDVAGCRIPNDPKAMNELLARAERLL